MRPNVSFFCCTTVTVLTCLTTLYAEKTDTEKAPASSSECSKEELMTFFPQPVVQSTLSQSDLTKEQVNSIAKELASKNSELVKIVEEKAAKLEPNPFKDLSRRDVAIKIYRETLYEVFASVLKAHGITNDEQIQSLLDKIQEAKSKLFIECIRKQQIAKPASKPAGSLGPSGPMDSKG
jgi:hypothetical protein